MIPFACLYDYVLFNTFCPTKVVSRVHRLTLKMKSILQGCEMTASRGHRLTLKMKPVDQGFELTSWVFPRLNSNTAL